MNWPVCSKRALFPSSQRRGGRASENVPLPIWRGRGGQFGEIFRPEDFAKLTTPSAALRWLRDFLLMPQPPSSAEEGNAPTRATLLGYCNVGFGFVLARRSHSRFRFCVARTAVFIEKIVDPGAGALQ